MITNATATNVETGGLKSTGNFSIKANVKAFKILSDGLYSDKTRAVIRELSCNAYDAHIAAGNVGTPFEVHLPNHLEPFFSVKDYGTGLDDLDVMQLYTTYFESTKSDSNDFIGALGLGSKSPFSYVDSFTVTSRFNGVSRIYSAFIGENGCPMIAKMAQNPTDEPNGLEVAMPVKAGDISLFRNKAQHVLAYFKPLPTITGNQLTLEAPEFIIDEPTWSLRKHSYNFASSAVAIQGNVVYPIDANIMSGRLTGGAHALLGVELDIKFPIGDIEVSASREALQYDQRTIANIAARLEELVTVIPPFLTTEIAKCKTLWEAKIEFHRLIAGFSYEMRQVLSKTQWNGIELAKEIRISLPLPKLGQLPGPLISRVTQTQMGRTESRSPINWGRDFSIDPTKDIQIYWVDTELKDLRRRLYMDMTDRGQLELVLIKADSQAELNIVLNGLGNPPLRGKTSDLPEPPKIKRYSQPVRILEYGGHDYWQSAQVTPTDGGLYVNMYKGDVFHNNSSVYRFNFVVKHAAVLGYQLGNGRLIGFQATHKNIPKKNPGWSDFMSIIQDKIVDLIADPKLAQELDNTAALEKIEDSSLVDFANRLAKKNLTPQNSTRPMTQFILGLSKLQAGSLTKERAAAIESLAGTFGLAIGPRPGPVIEIGPLIEAVEKAYPLLNLFPEKKEPDLKEWLLYINAKDSIPKTKGAKV